MACALAMAAALWLNSVLVSVGEEPATIDNGRYAGHPPGTSAGGQSDPTVVGAPSEGQDARVTEVPGSGFDSQPLPQPPTLALPTPSLVQAASLRIQQVGGQLTESEVVAVLEEAGWPESLFAEALAVSWCESKWSPYALGDGGRSVGLFQVNKATWFPYAGEDPELWHDAVVNARVALQTYYYDLRRGHVPWKQWSCRSAVY